jgi:uncharacterized protein (TIGR03067 family)
MRSALLLSLVLVVGVSAAPVPKPLKAKRPDAEVFVGEWQVETNGQSGRHIWTFDEDLIMWSKAVGANGMGSKWVIKIDPDKSPKHIDIGPDYKGIYEIDGDEIRLCYSGQRPANFDDKARTNYTVLRRAEKK